jgi:hypothetical protein
LSIKGPRVLKKPGVVRWTCMSIGLPFTRIPLDAWKLEFQERWFGLEVAAVGHPLRKSLRADRRRHLGVGAGPADGIGSCTQVMLGV